MVILLLIRDFSCQIISISYSNYFICLFLSFNVGVNEILISQILSFVILFLKSSHTLATYFNSLTISFLPTESDYTSYFSQIPLHWFCYYNHNHTSYTSHLIQILSFIHFGTKFFLFYYIQLLIIPSFIQLLYHILNFV